MILPGKADNELVLIQNIITFQNIIGEYLKNLHHLEKFNLTNITKKPFIKMKGNEIFQNNLTGI